MYKNIAWDTFKKTGNINTYLEFSKFKNIEENLNYFSFKDNGFKCTSCAKQDTGAFKMSEGTYKSIIYAIKSDIKKIYSITVPENIIKELEVISKLYLEEKLEKKY